MLLQNIKIDTRTIYLLIRIKIFLKVDEGHELVIQEQLNYFFIQK